MNASSLLIVACTLLCVAFCNALSLNKIQSLVPPKDYEFYGIAVAADGPHLLIVGGDNENTANAFFYIWDPLQKIYVANSQFVINKHMASGWAKVAIKDNRAVLGMMVVIYLEDQNIWVDQTTFYPDIVPYGIGSPALGNNKVFVEVEQTPYAVTCFEENDEEWTFAGNSSNTGALRMSDNTLYILQASQGILAYNLSETNFASEHISYTITDITPGWSFGYAFAVEQEWMVYTMYQVVYGAQVMQYNATAMQWNTHTYVTSMYNSSGDGFGVSVDVDPSSGTFAVGAPYTVPSPNPFVYIFSLDGELLLRYYEPDTDAFGFSVAYAYPDPKMTNPLVIVGAPFTLPDNSQGNPTGGVYIYQLA